MTIDEDIKHRLGIMQYEIAEATNKYVTVFAPLNHSVHNLLRELEVIENTLNAELINYYTTTNMLVLTLKWEK